MQDLSEFFRRLTSKVEQAAYHRNMATIASDEGNVELAHHEASLASSQTGEAWEMLENLMWASIVSGMATAEALPTSATDEERLNHASDTVIHTYNRSQELKKCP